MPINSRPGCRKCWQATIAVGLLLFIAACQPKAYHLGRVIFSGSDRESRGSYLSQPLATHIYTADPSAHVFGDRIYVYCSHDTATDKTGANGDHYDMSDYHVLSMKQVGGWVTDHGVSLDIRQVPWASRQLWAPDAAYYKGTCYLYFPAKDKDGLFKIGVAVGESPAGPFTPERLPIKGSYSIDPTVFKDADSAYYLYFGGIQGGQLQHWDGNTYHSVPESRDKNSLAILPRVARLDAGMKQFAEPPREVSLVDSAGRPFRVRDHDKRFFEGVWMHRYKNRYYLSYSTGDTHRICYAIGDNPNGPFTYAGVLLNPVEGWTTHHSIIRKGKKWYLFYHDIQLSGKNHLRNVKVTELQYNPDGTIRTITAFTKS